MISPVLSTLLSRLLSNIFCCVVAVNVQCRCALKFWLACA